MTLSAWQATVQDANGNIVPSAEVTVLVESTGLPATIYSSRGGAALTNPFFSDVNGFAQFYANKGEYRITATNGVFSNIFRYVRIGDAGGYDVQSSPSDATAGRLLTNETTHIGGNVNYTGANYQPETVNGLGVPMRLFNNGSSVASGGFAAASTLFTYVTDTSGLLTTTGGVSLFGTWKCISKGAVGSGRTGDFVRTA